MSDQELEARFASFATAPTGVLPGAGAARSRATQRTRRTRAALGGAGALVLVLAITAGAALGGRGGTDRVLPAGPAVEPQTSLSALLVDPGAVEKVRGGAERWAVRTREDLPVEPIPSGCRGEEEVFAGGTGTALRFLDGPDGAVLAHRLQAFAVPDEAQVAFGRLIDSVQACGGVPVTLVSGLPGSGPTRIYGRSLRGEVAIAYSVERLGPYLSAVALRSPGPEDRIQELPPLADVAGGLVREKLLQEDEPQPVEPVVEDGLLRAEDLAGIEPGAWQVQELDDPEGGLSDCQRRALDPSVPLYPDVGGWARITTDGHAGSLVQQETRRYPDADSAARVFDLYVEAAGACRTEEILDWPAETRKVLSVATHEVVEQSDDLVLVQTTYACATCEGAVSHLAVMRVGPWLTLLNMTYDDPSGVVEAARGRLIDAG